eukprot:TRINITY_DN10399_c0_g1_i1.p2 TRINITY_DN10399_c0_g1~~TRINITY_DN10399_c0_g1_i1.p2  ORF type:complete len:138 (+),score=32.07 TRINITY_DN10399_c0_g1_i1:58-414(+)
MPAKEKMVKKRRRTKPGTRAKREVKKLTGSAKLQVARAGAKRMILDKVDTAAGVRISSAAVTNLAVEAERFLHRLVIDAAIVTRTCKRQTLSDTDIATARAANPRRYSLISDELQKAT